MRTSAFDYSLPPERIAQRPAPKRDQSRLLVLERRSGKLSHHTFSAILDYMRPGDLLVLNDSKVFPARLRGFNCASGGEFEVLLLEENGINDWWALMRPAKRARLRTRIVFQNRSRGEPSSIEAIVTGQNSSGHRRLCFSGTANVTEVLNFFGEVPLPPYVQRSASDDPAEDLDRYQTVYAAASGSVAAPTAGLHFTRELIETMRERHIETSTVTLHVGVGTFAPVKADDLADHVMHEERFAISEEAATAINLAKREGRRVIAVGTTSARVLESAAAGSEARVAAGAGRTRLFIYPPHRFQMIDGLLTNFHLPRSTLLMLVSAFAMPGEIGGRDLVLSAYAEAVRQGYRFFSYGDAMLLL